MSGFGSDEAFDAFRDTARGYSTDAELIVLNHGMHAGNHTVAAYVQAIGDKIKSYFASGVAEIGRKRTGGHSANRDWVETHRDRRVVWVVDIRGARELHFQDQHGLDGEHANWTQPTAIGARVPDEFAASAIARNEQRWGVVETIDDAYVQTIKRHGMDIDRMRTRIAGSSLQLAPPALPRLDLTDVAPPRDQPDLLGPLGNLDLSKLGKQP